ncbi:hypothetical protein ACH5RR_033963 [Cinchona calisaya]|uniref:Uncharacterized protein n=1 Tax=Cinchona calisaya TaxID=153742 RepID=A0ABD2YE36_9GENT
MEHKCEMERLGLINKVLGKAPVDMSKKILMEKADEIAVHACGISSHNAIDDQEIRKVVMSESYENISGGRSNRKFRKIINKSRQPSKDIINQIVQLNDMGKKSEDPGYNLSTVDHLNGQLLKLYFSEQDINQIMQIPVSVRGSKDRNSITQQTGIGIVAREWNGSIVAIWAMNESSKNSEELEATKPTRLLESYLIVKKLSQKNWCITNFGFYWKSP